MSFDGSVIADEARSSSSACLKILSTFSWEDEIILGFGKFSLNFDSWNGRVARRRATYIF